MIQEALQWLKELSEDAKTPELLDIPGERHDTKHIVQVNGDIKTIKLQPGFRHIVVEQLDDLIEMANMHFDARVEEAGKMLVTYSLENVRLFFDFENCYEFAEFRLRYSREWSFFLNLFTGSEYAFEPRRLRTLLRTTLRETVHDASLIDKVSSISFQSAGESHTSHTRGGESLGKSINEQVAKGIELPQELQTFHVRMFANGELPTRHPITCLLDPDSATRMWLLVPFEESIINFKQANLKLLSEWLTEGLNDGVPVTSGYMA